MATLSTINISYSPVDQGKVCLKELSLQLECPITSETALSPFII